jgi:NAD(P)-dependent dehydrogenase (short-subunit alcohol dehydrogenase family)
MTGAAHAVVTGGGSGIGRAIALELARAGHRVTILGRDAARLDAVARAEPGIAGFACDVTDADAVATTLARAAEAAGPIGILVNCAGAVRTASFEKTDAATWDALWQVNVRAAATTTRAVLPGMRGLPAARIVNIASTAALKGYAYVSAYTATKHALLGLTRALAVELAGTAITVNAVCPGYAETAIIRDAVETIVAKTGRSASDAMQTFTGANPQGRLIQPEEVAATILWLVSDAARSVTGQAIVVAGGEIM